MAYNEDDKTEPISPYAISKLTIENYLRYFKKRSNLDYLILRYSNPYGPGQNFIGNQGIIPIFLNLIRQKKPITIFGDGENLRDYIFIEDLVNITKKIFDKKLKYSVYNVGSGENRTINEIVEMIEDIALSRVKIKKLQQRNIDVRRIALDIERIKNEVGYKEFISLEKGIRKTWSWLNKKNKLHKV